MLCPIYVLFVPRFVLNEHRQVHECFLLFRIVIQRTWTKFETGDRHTFCMQCYTMSSI
jgi:hypothetical protein